MILPLAIGQSGWRDTVSSKLVVVCAAASVMFGCFGSAYAVPVFFPALSRALAIPPAHLTALFSVTGAFYFALGMASGRLADRFGVRILAAVGGVVLASGLFLAAHSSSECTFDLACFLGVGGGVGLCYAPSVAAVQIACRDNPAVAGGVAASGIGFGTLILPPFAQLAIDHIGWRPGFEMMALAAGCSCLAALLLPHSQPGRAAAAKSAASRTGRLVSRRFLLLYAAQLLVSVVAFVPFAHLVLLAGSEGWSPATGSYLIALIGIGSLLGRILLSLVAGALGSCRTASGCAMLMAAGLALLTAASQFWVFAAVAALYGLAYGGVVALTGPITAELLGLQRISGAVGTVLTSRAIGILVGPWAVGVSAHRLGDYNVPFLLCAGLASLGALLFAVLHQRIVADRAAPLFLTPARGRPKSA